MGPADTFLQSVVPEDRAIARVQGRRDDRDHLRRCPAVRTVRRPEQLLQHPRLSESHCLERRHRSRRREGPTGSTGSTGPSGATGPTGPTGATGADRRRRPRHIGRRRARPARLEAAARLASSCSRSTSNRASPMRLTTSTTTRCSRASSNYLVYSASATPPTPRCPCSGQRSTTSTPRARCPVRRQRLRESWGPECLVVQAAFGDLAA